MELGQSIRKGVKWLVIGNTGKRILEFAFGIVLARLLVPADFGMIITIQVFTGFVGMLTTGGMGQALIRAKEADSDDFTAVFTLQLTIGILTYIVFYLAAPWFAEYFEDPLYEDLMRVSALFFIFRPFSLIRISWLVREMEFKMKSLVEVVTGVITGISSILMAWSGMGVWSLTLSGLLAILIQNLMLARITPLRLRLNMDLSIMRRHSTFGSKIVANDFLGRLRMESVKLILSKLAGPAFLGLYNKADSLHRLPFWTLGRPVTQTTFRAMSRVQDDIDQTKYMFYRIISLLCVYILPFYVGLWWVAEPFIGVVYGEKWLPSAEPLRILAIAGLFYIIARPCGVLLMAQNRLTQEMIAQAAMLVFTICACFIGLEWGLAGVSWGILASQVFGTCYYYFIAYRTIPTKLADLLKALAPGILLNTVMMLALFITHSITAPLKAESPATYLLIMTFTGCVTYISVFFIIPIPSLKTEVSRWRQQINGTLSFGGK
jgi:teichuronic acid exporter